MTSRTIDAMNGPDPDHSVRVVAPPRREADPARAARLRQVALLAGVVFVLDQASKVLIRAWLDVGDTWPADFELLHLSHVENSGAAFGILQGAGTFLVAASSLAIVGIVLFVAWGAPPSRMYSLALALVLGGAVGNLVDRVTRGTVTDFIDPTHYPAFNLADSAIVIGVTTLVIMSLFGPDAGRDAALETDEAAGVPGEVEASTPRESGAIPDDAGPPHAHAAESPRSAGGGTTSSERP